MESGKIKPINRRYKGVIKIKVIICSLLALLMALSNGYCTWPPAYASEPVKGEAASFNNSVGAGSGAAVSLAYDAAQPRLGKVVNCKYSVAVRSGPGTRYKKTGTAPKGAVCAVTGKKGSSYLGGLKRYWHSEAGVPWLYGGSVFISCDARSR